MFFRVIRVELIILEILKNILFNYKIDKNYKIYDGFITNKIKGYPLNFETPIMVEDGSLPLFKKSRTSDVIYCAGFYCIKGPEGWRKSFCPKRSTLTSLEEWEGPFATELEMVSVLNIKKKENVG